MPEMHLRQPGFTYSACEPFTENKERMQKLKETGDSRYIYQNELDKACFQHYMAYIDSKDLSRRTASDKTLKHLIKHLILLKIQKMMDTRVVWFQWLITFLISVNTSATPAR